MFCSQNDIEKAKEDKARTLDDVLAESVGKWGWFQIWFGVIIYLYESAYAPVTYNNSTNAGSRLDLNNGSPLDSPAKYGEDRVNSVLRKYPKYSSGPDYGGSGALPASATSYGLAPSASSSALAKSRSYSNFDSLKRTDFSSLNTLGQVSPETFSVFNGNIFKAKHKSKCSYIQRFIGFKN